MEQVTIRGETFQVNREAGILHVEIRQPFFDAGRKFRWLGSSVGFGLSKDALEFALKQGLEKIHVTVSSYPNKVYETTAKEWLNFAHETNSKMIVGETEIYVIQWNKTHFKIIEGS